LSAGKLPLGDGRGGEGRERGGQGRDTVLKKLLDIIL